VTEIPGTESAHDILGLRRRPLDMFFAPRNVAVIGATESPTSVGRTILWTLINSPFGGTVFPVNPKRTSVLNLFDEYGGRCVGGTKNNGNAQDESHPSKRFMK
jgi:hypothetical protein